MVATEREKTRWKQDFFDEAERIILTDPLSQFLGAQEPGAVMVFTYADAVKYAGHSCPSVAGAYMITSRALRALYKDETPVRGDIKVTVKGGADQLAYGPQSQVITLITGAAGETGFKGLRGKFSRKDLLVFDGGDFQFNTFIFERTDTGKKVRVTINPDKAAGSSDESSEMGSLMAKSLAGEATGDEEARFGELWQAVVRRILLEADTTAGLIEVEEVQ